MATGIYKRKPFTEEHRKRISEGSKLAGVGKWMQGKKRSLETKQKIMGENNPMKREENKEKMSKAMRGKHLKHGKSAAFSEMKRNAPPKPDRCEVCNMPESDLKRGLYCDHNHETGRFRGWLCVRCNLALGFAKDNVSILEELIKYIQRTQ